MDSQTTKKVVLEAPCKKCNDIERFSIKGCVVDCDKILAYFEKIFYDKESPCSRCGIPKLFKNSKERCVGCRLPAIYSETIKVLVQNQPWEGTGHQRNYQRIGFTKKHTKNSARSDPERAIVFLCQMLLLGFYLA